MVSALHFDVSAAQSAALILQLTQVTKLFPPYPYPAVNDIHLQLYQGELLALLGPSGCGKTTLLRLIAGFERPDEGTVAIAGTTVAGEGCWVCPEDRGIGMVFQDYALFPHLTVAQNVAFGLSKRGKAAVQDARRRVAEAIALVGLTGLEARYPHQLSGGQQQRVALARALAPRPFLVLLDEPLSNLDVQVRLRLRQELRDILKRAGTTAILVTHDQEEALSIADRVGVMRSGVLEQCDRPETIYHVPQSRFVAEFVTQANFIPAIRQGQHWHTELGLFEESQVVMPSQAAATDRVLLMLRQEELSLRPDDSAEIVVGDRQFLGREQRYSVNLPSGQSLIIRTADMATIPSGTPVCVQVQAQKVRAFSNSPPDHRTDGHPVG
jgi:iron(III) transport system ATP-binding protein